jgi:glycosyltransferase involved in cell wall biosynthesis
LPIKKVVISDYLLKKVKKADKSKSPLFKIKYSVLDSNFLKKRIRKTNKKKRVNILSVLSWYNPHKGPDLLIKAVKKLKLQNPKYLFTLVSKEKVTLSKVFDKFIFDPSPTHLKKLYKNSDYLLATSRSEGFYIPGLEAMASGTIFVTTDNGGVGDYALHRKNAIILKKLDDLWKKKIIQNVQKSKKLKSDIMSHGYETAREFSDEHIIKDFEKILFKR